MFPRLAFHIYVVFVLLFALSQQSFAQQGKVRFFVNPGHNYRIQVDGQLQEATNVLTLDAGKHQVAVWAPDYNVKDTTIQVVADTTVTLVMCLRHTNAWYKHQEEYREWKQARGMKRWPPVALIAAAATTALITRDAMNTSHVEYIDLSFDARFATASRRAALQEDAALANDRFQRNRSAFIASSIATAGCIGWAIWGIRQSKKIAPPSKKTANPWNLPDISLAPHPDGGMLLGLRIQLK